MSGSSALPSSLITAKSPAISTADTFAIIKNKTNKPSNIFLIFSPPTQLIITLVPMKKVKDILSYVKNSL